MECMKYSKIRLNLTFAALNLTFTRGQKAFPIFHADRASCGQLLFSVELAFVGRDEKRAPLKTPVWKARCSFDSLSPLAT